MLTGVVSRRTDLILALSIALLVIAIRAPLMDLALERDEGGYAYIAWRMSLGEMPYLDWFDQKPPGIYAVYSLALGFADHAVVAIRALAAVFSAIACIALFHLVRALLGFGVGLMSALLLAFLSADPMIHGSIANTEIFMLPGIIIATLLVLRAIDSSKPPIATSLAAGIAIGIAITFKQVAAMNVPFFLLAFGLRVRGPDRWRRLASFTICMGVGVALVWGPILAWLQLRGALGAALDATFLHNLSYAGALPLSRRLELLIAYGTPMLPSQGIAWGLAALGLVGLARRKDRFAALFLAGWALVIAVGVSASGHYFPHYFQQLLPAIAALAGAAVWFGCGRVGPPRWRAAAVGGLALAPLVVTAIGFWTLTPEAAIRRIYPRNSFASMPEIAREIESITQADDTVFLFGTEPEILFYARRASATRYIYLFPLFGPFPDARERQQGVIAEVTRARPLVLVWLPNQMFFKQDAPQLLTNWFQRFAARGYRIHALRVAKEGGGMELVRVPRGAAADAVLQGRKPSATIFIRSDAGVEDLDAQWRDPVGRRGVRAN